MNNYQIRIKSMSKFSLCDIVQAKAKWQTRGVQSEIPMLFVAVAVYRIKI